MVHTLDIENSFEFVTPYMLAVIKKHFHIAELLLLSGKVD
jgi:hypothetical protein